MTSITLIEDEATAPLIPIKTDQSGRRRLSAEHKEALLDAFETSSMSGVQFAKQYGLIYPTFATWVKKRKQSHGTPKTSASTPDFVELDLATNPLSALTVELADGARIKIANLTQIELAAALIKTLTR